MWIYEHQNWPDFFWNAKFLTMCNGSFLSFFLTVVSLEHCHSCEERQIDVAVKSHYGA